MSVNWLPEILTSVSSMPMTEGLTNRFSGGTPSIVTASGSLGGYIGLPPTSAFLTERYLPQLFGYDIGLNRLLTGALFFRMFNDVSAADLSTGPRSYYRCFFIRNKFGPCANATVYLRQPTVGTISLAAGILFTDSEGFTNVQRIINEGTAPITVVFTSPTSGSPLALGSMVKDQVYALWVKYLTPAGPGTPTPYMPWDMVLGSSSDTNINPFTVHCFHSLYSGYRNVTITGQSDNSIVIHPYGEVFTINVKDSGGVARDPAGSKVYVAVSGTFPSHVKEYGDVPFGSQTWIVPAVRTNTGIYRANVIYPAPGHYQHTFDVGGGEYVEQRSLEVSPIG